MNNIRLCSHIHIKLFIHELIDVKIYTKLHINLSKI